MDRDLVLQGNERIENAIRQLQKEPTQEMLAHALTVVRKRMKEAGHLIVALEQMKGSYAVMSAFTAEIDKIFQTTLQTKEVEGLILNPWDCTMMLSKHLIHIIVGENK